MGAAPTTTRRAGTARRPALGKRDGKVYVRNQRLKPLKGRTGSNLVDVGREAAHVRHVRATPKLADRANEEAMGKVCGVLIAMLQGQSWAPTPSTGHR
jgi:hypothetical protein